jgi:peptide-methionine (S)-S-oxide reductase
MTLGVLGATLASNLAPAKASEKAKATLAGGCFWCMEGPFEKLPGVHSVISGYSGGPGKNPTYEQVSAGVTGHAEVVQIVYDPAKLSYEKILEVFWHNIDPLTANAQFCDRGSQYRSAIFYHDEAQRVAALASLKSAEGALLIKGKVVTEIVAFAAFYPAEEYHQDFYKRNPVRYATYRAGCGRDRRLQELWGEAAGGKK